MSVQTIIGYMRVSTADQNTDLQEVALMKAGCDKIFEDVASGATMERSELIKALEYMREGDMFVVWKLDRVGRSLKHLIEFINELERRGIGFRSMTEEINTTTAGGKLVYHIFGAMAEFERELILERTKCGLAAARARGRLGGRPAKLTLKQVNLAKKLHADKDNSINDICDTLNISRATLYRYLKAA